MEKLYEKRTVYLNMEVDVVFRNSRTFDVTHDINTSFNFKLDNYFAYMKDRKGKIWLDIKDLTAENRLEALAGLNRLTRHFQIAKGHLIIESSMIRPATEGGTGERKREPSLLIKI